MEKVPPSPRASSGYVDHGRVYYFLTKHIGISPLEYDDFIEEIDLERLSWLFEEHHKEERQQFEILAHVISVGYARTQSKKKIKLFEDEKKTNKITREERNEKLKELKKAFRE